MGHLQVACIHVRKRRRRGNKQTSEQGLHREMKVQGKNNNDDTTGAAVWFTVQRYYAEKEKSCREELQKRSGEKKWREEPAKLLVLISTFTVCFHLKEARLYMHTQERIMPIQEEDDDRCVRNQILWQREVYSRMSIAKNRLDEMVVNDSWSERGKQTLPQTLFPPKHSLIKRRV